MIEHLSFNNIEMSGSDSENEKNPPPRKIKKKHYDQKYSKLWEKEEDYARWIEASPKGNKYFYCNACKCDLKCGGGKFVISKHAKSSKHLSNVKESIGNEQELLSPLKMERSKTLANEVGQSSSDKEDLYFPGVSKKKDSHKFKESWLSDPRLSNWIVEVNDKEVKCKYCYREIKCKLSSLLSHGKSIEHIAAVSNLKTNNQKNFDCHPYSMALNPDLSKPTCRVCLQNNDEEMSSIFDVDADFNNLHIYEEIEQCADITVLRHEKMPTLICGKCYGFLKVYHKFRTICRNSNEYLKEFVIIEENEEIEIALKENPLSIFDVSKKEVTCSQYKTRLEEKPSLQSQNVQNENVSPSNSKDFDDANFDDDLKEMLFDINYHDYVDDVSHGEHFEISIEQIDLDIKEESKELNQFKETVKHKKKSIAKEKKSLTALSKSLDISSGGAAAIREKKEKQSYICEVCGNTYYRRCSLELHMRRHRDEKPYECEICTYAFHSSVELIRHMRKHTGSKPFKCSYCSRSFGDKSTLIKHERIHRNERPFKCDTCGKSFTYSNVLKYHKYVHTGEKPYSCELCGKGFTRPHHLRAHLETLQHQSDPRSKALLKNFRKSNEMTH